MGQPRLTVRFADTCEPEERERITAALAKITGKHRKPPAHNPARHRAAMEAQGERHMTREIGTPDGAIPASARFVVRVFYRSEGGEMLAMDSRPLTAREADRLESDVSPRASDAIGSVRITLDADGEYNPRKPAAFSHGQGAINGWHKYRLVAQLDRFALVTEAPEAVIDAPIPPVATGNQTARDDAAFYGDAITAPRFYGAGAYSRRAA